MVIAPELKPVAEKQFIIPATPERVWELLGGAIFYSLPLENIDLLSEIAFKAVLRWRMAFISLAFDLSGELLNTSPPNLLDCVIKMRSKWGLLRQTMKVTFTLKSADNNKTEIVCRAAAEKKPPPVQWILMGMQRSMADTTIDAIKERLERLA